MDHIANIIDQLLGGEPEMDTHERRIRFGLFQRLFVFYREASADDAAVRMDLYLSETARIPIDKLGIAIRLVFQTHKYPKLPSIADIVSIAREVAGMNREQYHAGHYLPPPREWPPAGKRHAIGRGELEALPSGDALVALAGSGAPSEQLEAGER